MPSRSTLVMLFASLLAACSPLPMSSPAINATISPTWHLVYRHDADGRAMAGSKAELLAAVRRGAPIRFAWGVLVEREGQRLSVEHVAEPVFLSVVNGNEVVVQLPEHIAQRAYTDLARASFEDPAVMWRGLMTTQGVFDAVWVNRATGEQVRRHPQRVGLAWFAFQPIDPVPASQSSSLPFLVAFAERIHRSDA